MSAGSPGTLPGSSAERSSALARTRDRRHVLGGKRSAPRPARGARLRSRTGDRDDDARRESTHAESRFGRRALERSALHRRCVDPERRADRDPDSRARRRRPLPRFEWLEGKPAVRWRMLGAPAGFPCRIDRIGAGFDEWDALHQRPLAGARSTTSSAPGSFATGGASARRAGSGSRSSSTARCRPRRSRVPAVRDS